MRQLRSFVCLGVLTWLAGTANAEIDRDRDGLSDIWQRFYSVTGSSQSDPDRDGSTNLEESKAGTDPNDINSFLGITHYRWDPEGAQLIVAWLAQPGKQYSVQYTSALSETAQEWSTVDQYLHNQQAQFIERVIAGSKSGLSSENDSHFFRLEVTETDDDLDGLTGWEEYVVGIQADPNQTASFIGADREQALEWLNSGGMPATSQAETIPAIVSSEGIRIQVEDALWELLFYVKEEPEEALSEFPSDSTLGRLARQLQRLPNEDAFPEFFNSIDSAQFASIIPALQDAEWLDPEGVGEGSPLEEFLVDLFYFVKEEPAEAFQEFPPSSPLGSLGKRLQRLPDEESVFVLFDALDEQQRAQIEAELQRLDLFDPDSEDPIPADPDGEPNVAVSIPFPAGLLPVRAPQLAAGPDRVMSLAEASRFLTQATLGADYETIDLVSRAGFEAWINHQFNLPKGYHLEANNRLRVEVTEEEERIAESPFRWSWWEQVMKSPDLLRQRIAFALSEILVVSDLTDELEDSQWGLASYYDVLIDGAFGNYRDTLMRVTKHSVMGHWLSHARNQPTDLSLNRFPDENYAREVMQLFSIGLFELNQDGTQLLDAEGRPIPTYDNRDITELAKVFTGMTFNPVPPKDGTPVDADEFDDHEIASEIDYLEVDTTYLSQPMWLYEPMHEKGSKFVLGHRIPGGTIQQDLDAAIDILFNHSNTGPFIGYRLIQRLVTSNPSPDYVSRVAAAFNDNGQGIRGDMKAVVRAILLDPEARDLNRTQDPKWGMLREPYVRYVHLCRAFQAKTRTGAYRNLGEASGQALGQLPMHAPSVFNFFLPDHQPLGPLAEAGLVAPEFQITTATTSVATMNFWADALQESLMDFQDDVLPNEATLTLDVETSLVGDIPALIDRLDVLLTQGSLSTEARSIIAQALSNVAQRTSPHEVVRFALYLFLNSPDFAVLR